MISIKEGKNLYTFDEDTNCIYKNSKLISDGEMEPVFIVETGTSPTFAGIHIKGLNKVLGLSGNLNPLTINKNTIK